MVGYPDLKSVPHITDYTIKHRIKCFEQRGQTCGMYALEAAFNAFNINFPATAQHNIKTRNIFGKYSGQDYASIRCLAKLSNNTKIGEIFDVGDMVWFAKQKGLYGQVANIGNLNEFKKQMQDTIDWERLIIIAFYPKDTGKDKGYPDASGGKSGAHWGILFGYNFKDASKLRVLVAHGWGGYFDFLLNDLHQSNTNLKEQRASFFYKYIGSDLQIKKILRINNIDGPDYFEANTWRDIIGIAKPTYPRGKVATMLYDDKQFKQVLIPKCDFKTSLRHKMAVLWK